jgi:hypothetical protein
VPGHVARGPSASLACIGDASWSTLSTYVGLDVHKDTIAVAIAETGRRGVGEPVDAVGSETVAPVSMKRRWSPQALSTDRSEGSRTCQSASRAQSVAWPCNLMTPRLMPSASACSPLPRGSPAPTQHALVIGRKAEAIPPDAVKTRTLAVQTSAATATSVPDTPLFTAMKFWFVKKHTAPVDE